MRVDDLLDAPPVSRRVGLGRLIATRLTQMLQARLKQPLRLLLWGALVLVLLAFLLDPSNLTDSSYWSNGVLLVVGLFVFVDVVRVTGRTIRMHLIDDRLDLRIEPDGLRVTGDGMETRVPWVAISSVRSGRGLTLTGRGTGLLYVPSWAFDSPDHMRDFKRAVQQRIRRASESDQVASRPREVHSGASDEGTVRGGCGGPWDLVVPPHPKPRREAGLMVVFSLLGRPAWVVRQLLALLGLSFLLVGSLVLLRTHDLPTQDRIDMLGMVPSESAPWMLWLVLVAAATLRRVSWVRTHTTVGADPNAAPSGIRLEEDAIHYGNALDLRLTLANVESVYRTRHHGFILFRNDAMLSLHDGAYLQPAELDMWLDRVRLRTAQANNP